MDNLEDVFITTALATIFRGLFYVWIAYESIGIIKTLVNHYVGG